MVSKELILYKQMERQLNKTKVRTGEQAVLLFGAIHFISLVVFGSMFVFSLLNLDLIFETISGISKDTAYPSVLLMAVVSLALFVIGFAPVLIKNKAEKVLFFDVKLSDSGPKYCQEVINLCLFDKEIANFRDSIVEKRELIFSDLAVMQEMQKMKQQARVLAEEKKMCKKAHGIL